MLAWLHEVHAGPVLLALLDLLGCKDPQLLASAHARSRYTLLGLSLIFSAFYTSLYTYVAASTGAFPYAFMGLLSAGQRTAFGVLSAAVLAALTQAAAAAARWRARSANKERSKAE